MVAPNEFGVLQRMIKGHGMHLPPDVARTVIAWKFDDEDQARMAELSAKARAGSLNQDESRQLDWFLMLGDFLTIMQSQARLSLRPESSAS